MYSVSGEQGVVNPDLPRGAAVKRDTNETLKD
jgi:hypothetical protein